MDIFEYADSIDWNADYMDMNTGYTYGIQEAGKASKLTGKKPDVINVYSDNEYIGVVRRNQ